MVIASFGAMHVPARTRQGDRQRLAAASASVQPCHRCRSPSPSRRVLRMLDAISSDQRYVAASASMRTKLDEAIADARSTLEFVQSVPALAAAAVGGQGSARHGTAAPWEPFEAGDALRLLRTGVDSADVGPHPDRGRRGAHAGGRGELSFDDLLVLTRRLLQTRPRRSRTRSVPATGTCSSTSSAPRPASINMLGRAR